jgi:hypothetical protein
MSGIVLPAELLWHGHLTLQGLYYMDFEIDYLICFQNRYSMSESLDENMNFR